MTPKNRTLKGKNRTLGGDGGGSNIVKNRRTSFMDDPLDRFMVKKQHTYLRTMVYDLCNIFE